MEFLLSFILLAKILTVCGNKCNPCKYAVATLEGAGVCDGNISSSFARMIRRHVEKSTGRDLLLFSKLYNKSKSYQPLQSLFNTIAWTLEPKARMTSFGFAKVKSKCLAHRIWSIRSEGIFNKNSFVKSLIKKINCSKGDCK